MEEERAPEPANDEGEVVYRRMSPGSESAEAPGRAAAGRRKSPSEVTVAPALKTVVISFALLLGLVLLLGYLSVRKTDEVSSRILDEERRNAALLGFTLKLRIAVANLNNEARARGRSTGSTGETRPLFDMPMDKARDQAIDLLKRALVPPFSEKEQWRTLTGDLAGFIEIARDEEAFAREGYQRFQRIDTQLGSLLEELQHEQEEIFYRSEQLQREAARRIYLLTGLAILMGALVAAYTIREVQRRFRQMRQSMEMARREREFSTQMLEGMVSAVAAIDSHDHIRSANSSFFDIFPEASIGASVHNKFSSPDAMKMLEAATSTRVKGATYRGRWVCNDETPACTNKTFDVYSSPLVIDGEPGQIVTLVDVTEAAEAENVLRRTEALTAMGQAVAQVAHEIKNPLGSIRLGVSMLRDSNSTPESKNTIDLVERGIEHLNKLVVDVTQFSRQMPLERSPAELHALLDSSLELVADRIREKNAPLEKLYAGEELAGRWDADQLRQVFVNLFANALDAGKENSPLTIQTARVRVVPGSENRGNGNRGDGGQKPFARITIADQGSGMDEKTRQRIFEPFFTTKKRGTGLGLAIVKQIVEGHGGSISVESTPGQGTRFIVELPLEK
ncbi:MAG TPA: ATP-binding protein [Pyrinomonadaceae bacterium]|jgi:signal transduction histidine kinase